MYHIQIVGSGYTGSAIARHFAEKKQRVTVIKRTDRGSDALKNSGIKVIQTDLRNKDTLPQIPPANFIVFALAPESRSAENYRETYLRAVENYLGAIPSTPRPALLVYLSSTGVYADNTEEKIDETIMPKPTSERARILLNAEEQVLSCGLPTVIFRLSGIYGPGRNRIRSLLTGEWPEMHSEKILNMIHLEDIVQAITVLFNKGEPGKIYLGVDDLAVPESDFYAWLSRKLGVKFPEENVLLPGKGNRKQYNNARIKQLGWMPKHPSYQSGYISLIQEELKGTR